MRYYVTIEGRTFEIVLSGGTVRVDGESVDAHLSRVPGTPVRHLLEDGRSHALVADPAGREEWDIHLDGRRFEVEVVDERTRAIREMTGQGAGPEGPKPVKAPMPGLVVSVVVEVGDAVEPGQSVVIIEAMKMENDLKAENAGTVAKVNAEAGQPVEKGAVLVEFEADAGDEETDG